MGFRSSNTLPFGGGGGIHCNSMNFKDFTSYPATFISAPEGGFTVKVSGIDGVISEGDTKEEAIRNAVLAVADMANYYLDEKRQIPPAPAAKEGEEMIDLPFVMTMKLVIRNLMLDKGVSQKALASKVGCSAQLVSQSLDLARTRTSVDALLKYLDVLGVGMKVSLVKKR